jgi:hypothetical protein
MASAVIHEGWLVDIDFIPSFAKVLQPLSLCLGHPTTQLFFRIHQR